MRKRQIIVIALILAIAVAVTGEILIRSHGDAKRKDAETFVLRGGFTWRTTQEELLSLMDGYEYDEGVYGNYIFDAVPVAGYQGTMYVVYGGNVPIVLSYHIANGDVEKLTAALDAKYTPAEANEAELIALAQKIDRMTSEEETDYSGVFGTYLKHWAGPENTQIYLYQIEDDAMVLYINASALENADVSTPVNADGL